ncbi:YesL family protein [Enterococcus sp.]|uniref:YesL family protein n=1 Tax=Enterococcus sp. TaxID=35783 RepID=UPI002FC59096
MKEMKGIIKGSYVLGQTIIDGLHLQLLFLLYTLRGGIILGLFPALASVFQVIYLFLVRGKDSVKVKESFQQFYKQYFKMSNYLGYTLAAIGLFLAFDLRVSKTFIQSAVIHYGLIVLLVLFLGACLFVYPVLCRYELTYKQYLHQAVGLFFTNIIESIAMLFGTFLVLSIYVAFPILLVIAGVPLFIFPSIWFGLQAMKKMEEKASKV